MKKPELLAPAGSLDKLKTAVRYGADAVYFAAQKFGLRSAADNFTWEEIQEGIQFARQRQVSCFLVLNSFLHDEQLVELPQFLKKLGDWKPDALIISDLGVMQVAQKSCDIPIHLSTQASCLNSYSAQAWKQLGVKRLILGREVSIREAAAIKKETGLEVELFIHGSMCMAFSGHCTISNYTQGRDSNRGGCAHSCRFEYQLKLSDNEQQRKSYFMSSKDLQGLGALSEFIDYGIDSLKIEGRMKSSLYAATVTKVYREAIDFFCEHSHFYAPQMKTWEDELKKVGHRDYHSGSLLTGEQDSSIFDEREHSESPYEIAGLVLESHPDIGTIIQVKNAFFSDSFLEALPFFGELKSFQAGKITNLLDQEIVKTMPSSIVKIPNQKQLESDFLLRVKR